MAHAARIVVEDVREVGALLLDFEQLVDLFLVLDDGEADRAVGEDESHFRGDRILIQGHRHAAQHLRGAHRPVQARPVVTDDRQVVAALEAEFARPQAMARTSSATWLQFQVCQMPRYFSRVAGRSPRTTA
jgi:hypothetical protein